MPALSPSWKGIAATLVEQIGRPAVLLASRAPNGGSRLADEVLLMNASMEQLLGCRAADVEGRSWRAVAGMDEASTRCMDVVLARSAQRAGRAELSIRSGRGTRQAIDVEVRPLGRGARMVVVETVRAASEEPGSRDRDYVVRVDAGAPGILEWVRPHGAVEEDRSLHGKRCYEVLEGRTSACPGCPAFHPREVGERETAVLTGSAEPRALVRIERLADSRVQVHVRHVSDVELSMLMQARALELARRAALSAREQAVFDLLILGRSFAQIALVLGISRRTVKFHASNVLSKVGADSRIDLFRLLF